MDTYLSLALDIVKAQAKVRNMTEAEITAMVSKLAAGIRGLDSGEMACIGDASPGATLDAKKAIKERSICVWSLESRLRSSRNDILPSMD